MESKTELETKLRHARRNRMKRINKLRPKIPCGTPYLRRAIPEIFLEPLIKHLRTELRDNPPPLNDLCGVLTKLDLGTIALAALVPILNGIFRGWPGRDSPSAIMLIKEQIGEHVFLRLEFLELVRIPAEAKVNNPSRENELKLIKAQKLADDILKGRASTWKYLKGEWTRQQKVKVGHWLYECAERLDCFCYDEEGFLTIAPGWWEYLAKIRTEIEQREPFFVPHETAPRPWTEYRKRYERRYAANFVRDWRPQTKEAISQAFKLDPFFEHAIGVNNLARVPLRIDQKMVGLVERYAAEIMGRKGKQRELDKRLVADDVRVARQFCGTIWLDYNCDRRGRVYAMQYLNYGREDHVRALFKFDKGLPLDAEGLDWLVIHCANCEGSTDKKPFEERRKWVRSNAKRIKKIAANPKKTFKLWSNIDGKPFQYLAACIELAEAWANPSGFITHLPVSFDGTCNGIQHLAMLSGDADAGAKVNLTGGPPQDIYTEVALRVIKLLENDHDGPESIWWRRQFATLRRKSNGDNRKIRKLLKPLVMTFAYSISARGMVEHLTKEYRIPFENLEPREENARYLAKKVREACRELLKGPDQIMRYIKRLARYRRDYDRDNPRITVDMRFLKWTSPTGFSCENRYQEPNTVRLYLMSGGISVEHKVAEGATEKLKRGKIINSASPNFVHSLDAAHLIRVVNTSVAAEITDVLTVHDSFACHATNARRFREIICDQFATMYSVNDLILQLRHRNAFKVSELLPNPKGTLAPNVVRGAEYAWM